MIPDNHYTISNFTIGYTSLKVNTMLRYRQPFRNMSCYAYLGVTADYMLNGKNINAREIKFFSEETTEIAKAIPDPRNYDIGFVGGLGLSYKKLSFEVRKEVNSGMSDYTSLKARIIRWFFVLGYKFTKV